MLYQECESSIQSFRREEENGGIDAQLSTYPEASYIIITKENHMLFSVITCL